MDLDPPYNTGAKDWKYNNDYVDSEDNYRHSKWLSMMKFRLVVAKKLLKPDTGVLIVAIDEHEVHHLRTLLEELFGNFYLQTITCVTNPTRATQGRFSRVEENLIFCFGPKKFIESYDDPMLGENKTHKEVRLKSLLRSGTSASRADRKNMFYPVLVNPESGLVIKALPSIPFEENPNFDLIDGLCPVWPIRTDGSYGRWCVGDKKLNELIQKGYVKLGKYDSKRNTFAITYVSSETEKKIESGEIIIKNRDEHTGIVNIEYAEQHSQAVRTVWHRTRHNAGVYGSNLLASVFKGKRKFPFPKSVYATKDAISTVCGNNKEAIIVDFFAGSGTTQHAVALLNAEDGGNRKCISVTNNELSYAEEKEFLERGIKKGDPKWEAHGIANYITYPRLKGYIFGEDIDGNKIPGEYLVLDEFENPLEIKNGLQINLKYFKCELTPRYPQDYPLSDVLTFHIKEMIEL